MIKPIITDRKLLSCLCLPVDEYPREIVTDLLDTAASISNCAGLAAPQIGHFKRVILVKVQSKTVIMTNPRIVESKGKFINGREGCLSRPETIKKPIWVKRHNKITVVYQDINMVTVVNKFKAWEARLVQHEIDHLNGVLI